MEKILEEIKNFADKAHGEQTRKYTPDRYIVHPVRVMHTCAEFTDDITVLAAALLHDVLEDTPVTEGQIKKFLSGRMTESQVEKTLKLVVELTDIYTKENYPQLNRRARKQKEAERLEATSAEAQTIKCADIMDNSMEIVSHDPHFAKTYLFEGRNILKILTKSNPALQKLAIQTVENAIKELAENKS